MESAQIRAANFTHTLQEMCCCVTKINMKIFYYVFKLIYKLVLNWIDITNKTLLVEAVCVGMAPCCVSALHLSHVSFVCLYLSLFVSPVLCRCIVVCSLVLSWCFPRVNLYCKFWLPGQHIDLYY